jgi:CubicO group peptidase (beta-lactamase class C family)
MGILLSLNERGARRSTRGARSDGPYVTPVEESFRWHPNLSRSESIAAFIPALELLITEAMDEWKIPGLAVAVVQSGEVALVGAYGLRDVEAGLKVTTDTYASEPTYKLRPYQKSNLRHRRA